jgi:uncharacterized membrane protein
MTEPAGNYIPVDLTKRFRTQAMRVWGVTAAIAAIWVLPIVTAPLLSGNAAGGSIYTFFSYICHQIPERSLHLEGHPLAVCTRCFGVYFGLFAGLLAYPLWRRVDDVEPLPRFWLFLSLVPIGIDWSLTVFGVWENTHLTRFITGTILGAACATYIVPAAVEIKRNLTLRSRSRA